MKELISRRVLHAVERSCDKFFHICASLNNLNNLKVLSTLRAFTFVSKKLILESITSIIDVRTMMQS